MRSPQASDVGFRKGQDELYGVPIAALMVAVFTVSVGFSIVLPLLPDLIGRLLGLGVQAEQISWHTGLLTSIYTLALFLFAPLWGKLSDRHGPRVVLMTGLLGFGITMLVFSFLESLIAIYVERFLSGMFAAAVTPVAAAAIGEFTLAEEVRGRRLAYTSMAGIAGFLLGPMLSVLITRFATDFFSAEILGAPVTLPLTATALLAFVVAAIVAGVLPGSKQRNLQRQGTQTSAAMAGWLIAKLLTLSFVVSAGIGAFEVGLVLLGKQKLGLTAYQVAMMFTECSLVMFVMQAIVFSPWVKTATTRWLIAPALVMLSIGLLLVPWASNFFMLLVAIGLVAASAGMLSPILTYWISARAGQAQGWELGKQTAAASLGITVGAAAGGILFNAAIPGTPFFLAAALTFLGFLLGFGLPRALMARNLELISPNTKSYKNDERNNHGY